MHLNFEWREKTGKYEYGNDCYPGKYCVGHIHYPTQSKDYEGPRWRPDVHLPDVRVRPDVMKNTRDEAKAVVERVVTSWFTTCLAANPADGV